MDQNTDGLVDRAADLGPLAPGSSPGRMPLWPAIQPAGNWPWRAGLDPGDRVAIYCDTLNFRLKFFRLAGAAFLGWWVRVSTQQALLSGSPGQIPSIQTFGLNF